MILPTAVNAGRCGEAVQGPHAPLSAPGSPRRKGGSR